LLVQISMDKVDFRYERNDLISYYHYHLVNIERTKPIQPLHCFDSCSLLISSYPKEFSVELGESCVLCARLLEKVEN
jgi:hypothetical protein